VYKAADPASNFIPDLTHGLNALTLRVRKRPVITNESGDVRALVSAAHRDKHLGILGQPPSASEA